MRALADKFFALLALLVMWTLLHIFYGSDALASPLDAVQRLLNLISSGQILPHALVTLDVWLRALVMAVSVGVAGGLLLGLHRTSGLVLEPFIVALSSLPKVTLYPMVLLTCGLGPASKIVFGFLHGVLPILLFTLGAARQVPLIHLKSARTMRVPTAAAIRHVILPAMLPAVFSGIRLGASLTLLGVLIGEMFGAQKGLGFLLMNAMELNDTAHMAALSLLLLVVALVMNAGFSLLIRGRATLS